MNRDSMQLFFMGEPTTLQAGDKIMRVGRCLIMTRKHDDGGSLLLSCGRSDGCTEIYFPWLEGADHRTGTYFMAFLAGTHGLAIEYDAPTHAGTLFRLVKL